MSLTPAAISVTATEAAGSPAGPATLEEVVWSDPSTGLHFLPTAIEARLAHTSDILLSEAMEQRSRSCAERTTGLCSIFADRPDCRRARDRQARR